jgi:hypothetical protein
MWCPRCLAEYRPEFQSCAACGVPLVPEQPDASSEINVGPLTGRPIGDEITSTGPTVAGSFVTMEEAQAALRALSEEGISADVLQKDEQFPMTISGAEPGYMIGVGASDLGRAQQILKNRGLLPTAIGRYAREEDAHRAVALLEQKGLRPRISKIVMDDVPTEFQAEMEPYVLEVPASEEMAASKALEGTIMKVCDYCSGQIYFGDEACKGCGERVLY